MKRFDSKFKLLMEELEQFNNNTLVSEYIFGDYEIKIYLQNENDIIKYYFEIYFDGKLLNKSIKYEDSVEDAIYEAQMWILDYSDYTLHLWQQKEIELVKVN
jgi:hypothetical protein